MLLWTREKTRFSQTLQGSNRTSTVLGLILVTLLNSTVESNYLCSSASSSSTLSLSYVSFLCLQRHHHQLPSPALRPGGQTLHSALPGLTYFLHTVTESKGDGRVQEEKILVVFFSGEVSTEMRMSRGRRVEKETCPWGGETAQGITESFSQR